MNDTSNYFGLISCAALFGAVVGLFFPSRKARLAVAMSAALLSLIPWSSSPATALANRIFAFYDVPCVATLFVMALALWKPEPTTFRVGSVWKILPIIVGLLLYLSEFNIISVDLYRLGYMPTTALILSGAAVLLGSLPVVVIMCAADVLHAIGVYANFFDAVLDFPFWLGMTGYVAGHAISEGIRNRRNRKGLDKSTI